MTALKPAPPKKPVPTSRVHSIDKIKSDLTRQYPDFTVHLIRIASVSNVVQFSGSFDSDPFYYGKYYSRIFYDGETGRKVKRNGSGNRKVLRNGRA